MQSRIKRDIRVPSNSTMSEKDYADFLMKSFERIKQFPQYLTESEDINSLELAHLIPDVPESIIAIYLGINDAVCNKGLVSPFLVRHGHNNVFVYDSQYFAGKQDVPSGTIDAREVLEGFEPPNETWNEQWTYVMIADPKRSFESLWQEKGYVDMIAAKFEDFTMLSDHEKSRVCTFIDPKAFEHPVNRSRDYLKAARDRGQKHAEEFTVPRGIEGETDGLEPVILHRGEKLYVATTDFGPCAHAWSNLHPANEEYAVINENSAVPLDLVIAKPEVKPQYAKGLNPAKGSADMTTDWFYRGSRIVREPILQGTFKG